MEELFRFLPLPIKFDEKATQVLESDPNSKNIPYRVQLLRTGTFYHHQMGEIKVTSEMLKSMIQNFTNRVRGIDLAIDYKHDSEDIAAGWIDQLELSEDEQELWAVVKWTPQGMKRLADKEFRYLSADFHMNHTDNETLQTFGPTLYGAGLTNRPVVKKMEPVVTLMEKKPNQKKGNDMSDELKTKIASLEAENKKLSEENKKLGEDYQAMEAKLQDFDMSPEEMKKLISELKSKIEYLEKEKEAMMADKKLAEKNSSFDKLLSEGKAVEAQRDAYLKDDMAKFIELAGEVNFAEKGTGKEKPKTTLTYEAEVMKLAEEKVNKGMDLGSAISVVLTENDELRKNYEAESLI